MGTPISGKDGKATWGPGATTLAITKWKLKKMTKALDVSNTTDGRRRIAGLRDAEGSFTLHVDTDADISTTIVDGDIAALKLYINSTKFYSFSAIVEDLDFSSEVEGSYDCTANFKLAIGTVTVPI